MHLSSKLCIYLCSTLSTYGAPRTLQPPAAGNNCFGCCFWLLWRLSSYRHTYLSTYLSIYPSVCLSYLSSYLSVDSRSVDLSIYLSVRLSVCPSVCLSVCLSIYRSIDLSVYRSIDVSTDRSIDRSIYLHINQSTNQPICLSRYPSIDLSKWLLSRSTHNLYLSASPLSVCLSILPIFSPLHLSVNLINLFFYSPSIYKPIDASKLVSLSIHTSRLGAIRFQDDLNAAHSFWAQHAPKGTRHSWSNGSTICSLCLPGYPQ